MDEARVILKKIRAKGFDTEQVTYREETDSRIQSRVNIEYIQTQ